MTKAIYVNMTGITGQSAVATKQRIRERLRECGAVRVGSIYRNPMSREGHRYRFLRIPFQTKDDQ